MKKSQVVTQPVPEPFTMTVANASIYTGIGRTTLFRLIENGTLESVKVGKKRLIYVASLRHLLETGAA
jgi:excisionase family DNA binding protein